MGGNSVPKFPLWKHIKIPLNLNLICCLVVWGSKIWAHDLGPGTTFHQQYARGEEITEDRCN